MLEFEQGSEFNRIIKKKEQVLIDSIATEVRELCEPVVKGLVLSGGAFPQLAMEGSNITEKMPDVISTYNNVLTTALSITNYMFYAREVSQHTVLIEYPEQVKKGLQELYLCIINMSDNITRFLGFATREEESIPPTEYGAEIGFAFISVEMEKMLKDVNKLKTTIQEAIDIFYLR